MTNKAGALIACIFLTTASFAQENEFSPVLIKNLFVDSVHISKMVQGDSGMVKKVVNKAFFNAEGNVAEYITIPEDEYGDTVLKVYTYMMGKPVQIFTYKGTDEPVETRYLYKNGLLAGMTVTGAEPRDYDIFMDNEGRILEKNGKTLLPEVDSATGEATGNMVWQSIDAYEYKYNKYKKVTQEIFNFYGKEAYKAMYDYGPTGSAPLQKKLIYRYESKNPDTEITYTYTPTSLLASQVVKQLEDGFTETLEYEYFYATKPVIKGQPTPGTFTPPPPPKMPKGKGDKVKDYKNPNW